MGGSREKCSMSAKQTQILILLKRLFSDENDLSDNKISNFCGMSLKNSVFFFATMPEDGKSVMAK